MPWFEWNGVNSNDFGIWVSKLPQPVRPEERAEEITIPGRAGSLLYKEGENVHNAYTKECVITTRADADYPAILNWLTGDGKVTFSNEPDRVYTAHIVGQVAFDKISNSLKQATIPFLVNPHKAQNPTEPPIAMDEDGTVYNPGTVTARPLVEVTFTERGSVTIDGAEMRFADPAVGKIRFTTWDLGNSKAPFYAEDTVDNEKKVVKTAHIQIVDASNNVAAEWDCDASPHTVSVGDGTYTVHVSEVTQPDGAGYVTPSDLAFIVQDSKLKYTGTTVQITDAENHTGASVVIGNDNLLAVQFSTTTATPTVSNPTPAEKTIYVDCDAQIITDDDGIWRGASVGDFWLIKPGSVAVSMTGAEISIAPRWRWY